MRPRSLHLQGFTVFRSMDEPISFVDADLFALTGSTGSGKTSLLDAMCFALYGRVPRLDARAVEPVIALGVQEARILFEFSVGEERYTAARVVRRTKTGATTPEARLEIQMDDGPSVVLASGADEVNETVAVLLGLTFDHFTKTVLLPQGAFATFLHDTPARRQDLLRTLLDLGVYEQMRELAQHRKSRAEGEAAVLVRDLERLATVTPVVEKNAQDRVGALRQSTEIVRETQPDLDRLATQIADVDRTIEATSHLAGSLETLSVPADVNVFAEALAGAEAAVASAESAARQALDRVATEETRSGSLPDVAELSALDERWKQHRALVDRRDKGRVTTDAAQQSLDQAGAQLEKELERESQARQAASRVEARHQAHSIALGLEAGDDCPVCLRTIEDLPPRPALPLLDEARLEVDAAAASARSAAQLEAAARAHLDSCVNTLKVIESDLADADAFLASKPAVTEIQIQIEEIRRRTAELARLRTEQRDAQTALDQARTRLAQVKESEAQGRRDLSAARDRLAGAEPPELAMDDLVEDWRTLVEWAAIRRGELKVEIGALTDQKVSLEQRASDHRSTVQDRLVIHGLDGRDESPVELLIAALADAELALGRIRADREAAERATAQLGSASKRAEVAKTLARHLQAGGFEGWLMEEALHGLVAGANVLLHQLSSGAYSLEMSKRDFMVIDHRNADETRGVKTLSGGETFLVSLALALSLAEQIGAMAAGGTARLESIFLDEGFGTLDVDTLDVVAAVIQELGASGRTVGLVTHVTELAELVPTRFEVVRGAGGSSVRRIDT